MASIEARQKEQLAASAASPRVRVATAADEEGVIALCHELHGENGLFPIDEQRVRWQLKSMLARENGIIGVIGNGKLEGCIAMMIDDMWYSDKGKHLLELFNFVHPDFRSPPGRAKALIKFAKKCADELELPLIIGIISNERTEAKVRLYQRQLTQVGAFFLYGATTGEVGDGRQE